MATTRDPTVVVAERVLAIPPRWRWPSTFPFLMAIPPEPTSSEGKTQQESEDRLPTVHLVGPAKMLPSYIDVKAHGKTAGEAHMMQLIEQRLPQEAIVLMTQRPIKELIQRRAVWFPSPRHDSNDAFLTDLRVAHERGLFPVYFDRLPASDAATAIGGVQIPIPASVLIPGAHRLAEKWKRALLKITRLHKDEAQAALLDLPDAFSIGDSSEAASNLEAHLFRVH